MQTCTLCNTQSPDTAQKCVTCGADLAETSQTAVALRKFQENSRVYAVHVITHADSCPVCQDIQGTYPKDRVPKIPVEGCSHPDGCRCFYQPMLEEIYP